MSTNEHEEDEGETSRAEVLRTFLGDAVRDATDTRHTGLNLRTWVLIVVLGLVVTAAPFPANYVGIVALLALALTLASRVRGTPK